ncbi:MAG: hypothetical protein Q8N31_13785 [Reyranella sp.]|nr:hypothetical protein [Reyranella sp.]MDP3161086.1 hypothetical protein [Reyranella sp.]
MSRLENFVDTRTKPPRLVSPSEEKTSDHGKGKNEDKARNEEVFVSRKDRNTYDHVKQSKQAERPDDTANAHLVPERRLVFDPHCSADDLESLLWLEDSQFRHVAYAVLPQKESIEEGQSSLLFGSAALDFPAATVVRHSAKMHPSCAKR